MRRRLAGLLLALGWAACDSGDGVLIGERCTSGNGCGVNPRAACILAWPGGYCTETPCSLGSCPSGSRCVTRVTFQDVALDSFCLETCDDGGDCRDGYLCVDISTEKVCAPARP